MNQTMTRESRKYFEIEAIEGIAEYVDTQESYENASEPKSRLREFVGICMGMSRYISFCRFVEFYGEKVEIVLKTGTHEKFYIRWFKLSPLSMEKQQETMWETCFEIIKSHRWSRVAACPLDCIYDEKSEEIGLVYDELWPEEGTPVYKLTSLKLNTKLVLCRMMFDTIATIHAKGIAFGGMQKYDCRLFNMNKEYEIRFTKGLCGQTNEGTIVKPGYADRDLICPPKWNYFVKKNDALYSNDNKYKDKYDERIRQRKQYMDIYSLVVISFFLLVGCHPLKGSALYGMSDPQHIQYECQSNPLFIFSPKDDGNRIGYYQSEQMYIEHWENLSDDLKELYCMMFAAKNERLDIPDLKKLVQDWSEAFNRMCKAV